MEAVDSHLLKAVNWHSQNSNRTDQLCVSIKIQTQPFLLPQNQPARSSAFHNTMSENQILKIENAGSAFPIL